MAPPVDTGVMLLGVGAIAVGSAVVRGVYSMYFHPLSNVPGPKHYALTDAFYLYHVIRGNWHEILKEYHDKYGPSVRFGPNDVSFIDPTAWKAIYGHKKRSAESMDKDLRHYRPTASGKPHIIVADNVNHRRMRRILSHAFSEKALRAQSTILQQYTDLFMSQMNKRADTGEVVDIMSWYNFATFDLIGDLAFGRSFDCLEKGDYHPFVSSLLDVMQTLVYTQAKVRHPALKWLLPFLTPEGLGQGNAMATKVALETAEERIGKGDTGRADFMSYILRNNEDDKDTNGESRGMTRGEILDNSFTLLIAGSETTATQLSGATYRLLTNPDKYDKLVAEIRGTFKSEDEITMSSVNNLKYLIAVFSESFRMYPPVPIGMPRITPGEGATIAGHYIPENTSVSIPHYSAYRCEQNWLEPESFIPERWLGDPAFADDKRDILQPFNTGPRDCIGKNLAYAEMRVILCRILFNFDLELMPECRNWDDQRIFFVWRKDPLNVKITRRRDVNTKDNSNSSSNASALPAIDESDRMMAMERGPDVMVSAWSCPPISPALRDWHPHDMPSCAHSTHSQSMNT